MRKKKTPEEVSAARRAAAEKRWKKPAPAATHEQSEVTPAEKSKEVDKTRKRQKIAREFTPLYDVEKLPREREKNGFVIMWKGNFKNAGKCKNIKTEERRKAAQFINELQRFPRLLEDSKFIFSASLYDKCRTNEIGEAKAQVIDIIRKAENVGELVAHLEANRASVTSWQSIIQLFYNYK